ncbi:MAG: ABC transporter permease subunit [Treponema sp.]|jgi:putative aldouronate transport system permease protein|nr:ABC transporter permease subunit [Treponema sp.]
MKNQGFPYRARKNFTEYKYAYFMLLPVAAYYIIFHYIPMGGIVIAFKEFRPGLGFFRSPWVGLEHFVTFFSGPYAWRVIRNTLLINLYELVFQFPMPIVFALLLNELRGGRYKKFIQTLSYLPHFISVVVMCGIIVSFTSRNGIVSQILSLLGQEPMNLLIKPEWFRPIFVGSTIWKTTGWASIIYIATLSRVDPALYEAAAMDGAGRFLQTVHITLPVLFPIITIQLILRIGHIMSQGYEKVILLYNPMTYEVADIVSSYVYRAGLERANYSFGAAVGIFNSVVNMILLVSANRISRKINQESLW